MIRVFHLTETDGGVTMKTFDSREEAAQYIRDNIDAALEWPNDEWFAIEGGEDVARVLHRH